MKRFLVIILNLLMLVSLGFAQNQQAEIDSLVNLLRTAGREWNDYANPLIKIGEPAVPSLIKNAEDKKLEQWNRRISVMTLNQIHSSQWKKPALKMLFDQKEDPILRNHAITGLRGFDLSGEKTQLWKLYNESMNESYKSNLANLLLTADTSMAYQAFHELFHTTNSHIQKNALVNLAQLRIHESSIWFLKGIQVDDWMTANLAMDSLISSRNFNSDILLSIYRQPGTTEEVRWRIVFVFGHRNETESIPVLVEAIQNESWLVHNEAAVGLCRMDPRLVLKEMKALKNDSRLFVRQNAKWVMEKMESNKNYQ